MLRLVAMDDADRKELEEYRRQDLLRRMQEISREHWSKAWQVGLEHDLYLMTFHGVPAEYGVAAIAPAVLERMRQLAELTRVWWVRSDAAPALHMIALDEAERRFSKLIAEDGNGDVHSMSVAEVKDVFAQATPDAWSAETVAAPWSQSQVWRAFRLRALPVLTLVEREDQQDWELRFGKTTVAFVQPAWATQH
jgi:hypothetical protein